MCTQYTTLQSQLHRFASEYFYLQWLFVTVTMLFGFKIIGYPATHALALSAIDYPTGTNANLNTTAISHRHCHQSA